MRTSRLVLALALALIGLVWVGQGVGLIGGSAMTGSPFWGFVGLGLVVAAAAILVIERRRASRR
jgi:glucose dehydrogenase